jgi:hypothetical protein
MLSAKVVNNNKKISNTLGQVAERTAKKITPDLSTLSSLEAGGVIRTVATAVISEVGQAATVAGVQGYKDLTDEALKQLQNTFAKTDPTYWALGEERTARFLEQARSYTNRNLAELNAIIVADPRNSAAATARMWLKNGYNGYAPTVIDVKKVLNKNLESVVGYSMSKYVNGNFANANEALSSGVSRMVENIYRDTIATNSEFDNFAQGYQRIASPLACAFCMTVALNEYTTFEESGGYHDHCSCSVTPIYGGMKPYRPDYYEGFEEDYRAGNIASQSSDAKEILASIREITGRK